MTIHPDVHYEGVRFASVPHQLLEEVADPIAIALYAHLMKFADWSTGLAHPKRETLAKLMGYKTTKAVDSAVKVLVKAGWMEAFPRWSRWNEETNSLEVIYESRKGFNQTSNGYRLFDRPRRSGGVGAPEGTHPLPTDKPTPYPQGHTNNNHKNKNHKTSKDLDHPEDDRFVEFWDTVPRKVGKGAARKAWAKAVKKADPQVIIEGMRRYRDDPNRSDEFTAHPSSWLNAERWDDDPLPARGGSRRTPSFLDFAPSSSTTRNSSFNAPFSGELPNSTYSPLPPGIEPPTGPEALFEECPE